MQPEISDHIFYSFLTGGLRTSSTTSTTTTTSSFYPFAIEDLISQDKALVSLRNHKEAERRRREKINSHLNKLRNLLSCNSKTDKATILAKVVERVKELKQQTLEITTDETLPSETDEISVLNSEEFCSNQDGRIILKITFCCEDRPNLLQDLMEIFKSFHMDTLFADLTTVGDRSRNVIVVAVNKEHYGVEVVKFLRNALKSLIERSSSSKLVMMGHGGVGSSGGERLKRRRAMDHIIMV